MSIGTNIKKRRYELKMTQQELADLLGYKTRSTIARIESGDNSVSYDKLQLFAKVLDTSVESLVSGLNNNTLPESTPTRGTASPNIAVILAGGKSSRNSQNIPNQFINVNGKPLIIYCLEKFQNHPAISDIYIVCLKGWEGILQSYLKQYQITKIRAIINGGSTGILSIKNAVDFVQAKDDSVILFHESTRPNISEETISKIISETKEYGNAVTCNSMEDYLQFVKSKDSFKYVDRNTIVEAQTPEAYLFKELKNAFRTATNNRHKYSESICYMFMYNLGYKIHFVEGSRNNIKIVRQEDLNLLKSMRFNE